MAAIKEIRQVLCSQLPLIMKKKFVSAKARIVFGEVRSVSNELENQYSLQFSKSAVKLDILLKFLLLCQVDIQKGSLKDNTKFNFLRIIWESKRSWGVHFSDFQSAWNPKFWAPGCTRIIKNLLFWDNRSVELML